MESPTEYLSVFKPHPDFQEGKSPEFWQGALQDTYLPFMTAKIVKGFEGPIAAHLAAGKPITLSVKLIEEEEE